MTLNAGGRIGPYEILGPLGAGGMGEVFKARDDRLHRFVALKLLPPAIEGNPDARRRLEAEARAAAALDHPFICKVFDIGDADGRTFIVMEAVSGETLRSRLTRGPLSMAIALPLTVEIAEALAAAHRGGIVHRDLKPANVMIADDGHVKILDFGLAAVVQPDVDADLLTTADRTSPDVLKGTLAYMSPEQLRRQPVDARSDVFAFGILLYEMLTATHPFPAPTSFEVASAILQRDPQPWPPDRTPTVLLQHIVRKTLAKEPGNRYQSMHEVLTDLRAVVADGASGGIRQSATVATATGVARASSRRAAVVTIALMIALAGIGSAGWFMMTIRRPSSPVEVTHRQITHDGLVLDAALSPDGRTIAFVAERPDGHRLMVQDGVGPPLEIARADLLQAPRWSPDGTRIVYAARDPGEGWKNLLVSRLGGPPRRLDVLGEVVAWSGDGSQLAVQVGPRTFQIISTASGETAHDVTLTEFGGIQSLDWQRTSNRLAIIERNDSAQSVLWSMTSEGKDRHRVFVEGSELSAAQWGAGDTIYCLRQRNDAMELLAVDASGREERPRVLLSGLVTESLSVSADGRSALMVRFSRSFNLAMLRINRPQDPLTPITNGTGAFGLPRVSPDGKWIATDAAGVSGSAIVKIQTTGGVPIPLTSGEHRDTSPAWSPDGMHIVFASDRGGTPGVWMMNSDGQQQTHLDVGPVSTALSITWLPDGRIAWKQPSGKYVIRAPMGGEQTTLTNAGSVGQESEPKFAPKGDRVAVSLYRPPQQDGLWTLLSPGHEEKFLKARTWPLGWSPDGQSIYAVPADGPGNEVWIVAANTGESRLLARVPARRVDGGDVTPDGQYLVLTIADGKSDVWIVEHFDPRVRPD